MQLVHYDAEAAQGELTPLLDSILKKARQLGELPARIAKSSIKALKTVKTDKIVELFRELEAMGHATVNGKTLIPHVDRADLMLTLTSKAKTIDTELLQSSADKNVGLVDRVDHFLEEVSTAKVVGQDNNSQQNQQINILDERFTELNTSRVDFQSTAESTFSEPDGNLNDLCLDAVKDDDANVKSSTLYIPQPTTSFPATEKDIWLKPDCLQGIADILEGCFDSSTLIDLKKCWPDYAIEAACKLLEPEARQRIMQLILEQNSVAMTSDTHFVPGARAKVGDFYGTLAARTPNGKWLINWDKSRSQQRLYGDPPAGALAIEQIEIIKVAT